MTDHQAPGPEAVGSGELAAVIFASRAHPTPMAVLSGRDGTLQYNDACAPLLGARHPDAIGRPWQQGWPELFRALDGRHLSGPREGRIAVTAADGTTRTMRCASAPIPGETGSAGALVVFQPVTEGAGHDSSGAIADDTARRPIVSSDLRDSADDLADLASLDIGTICAALGRLIVPSRAQWAIIWLRSVDRAGRTRLDRRDVPSSGRRRAAGSSVLADRLGVGRVIATGTPLAGPAPAGHGLPGEQVLTVPLRDKRRVVGALTLGGPTVGGQDPAVRDLADRAGVSLANASRFRIEHSISRDLQRLLAPRPLPSVRGVEMAARLIAGSPGVTVGGDWYDGCELPDGRLALTIGDVVGHGLRSAVEMTQLRTGLRNLAMEGLTPAEVLAGADEFLRRTGAARFVTCIHAVLRPDTGQLDMANAGHLRPVHLPLDALPRLVPIGTGLPLGGAADLARAADRAAVATCRITLRPGESMLLFTDGLVESRSRSADDGAAALVQVLARASRGTPAEGRGHLRRRFRSGRGVGPGARQLCELAVSSMLDDRDGEHDDVAVVVLRRRHPR